MKTLFQGKTLIALGLAIVVGGSVVFADRDPRGPVVNYLDQLDAEYASEEQSAWRHYQSILDRFVEPSRPGLPPREALPEEWAPYKTHLEANRSLLPSLVAASRYSLLGQPYHPYRYATTWCDFYTETNRTEDLGKQQAERSELDSGYMPVSSAQLPSLIQWRHLVNLLAIASRDAVAREDFTEAQTYLDTAGRIAQQLLARATAIEQFVGWALFHIASQEYRTTILGPAGRKMTDQELEDWSYSPLCALNLRSLEKQTDGEWLYVLDLIQSSFSKDGQLIGPISEEGEEWFGSAFVNQVQKWRHASKSETLARVKELRQSALDRLSRGESIDRIDEDMPEDKYALIKVIGLPRVYQSLADHVERGEAQAAANRLALALARHEETHGSYPEELSHLDNDVNLSPKTLEFGYRLEDGEPYLWSTPMGSESSLQANGSRESDVTVYAPSRFTNP